MCPGKDLSWSSAERASLWRGEGEKERRKELCKDRTPLCIHTDTHTHTHLVMFSSAFTILIRSSWYPVSPTSHHGMACSPGSLYNERCHTDGNRSRDTASPYKTRAWRSDIKTNVDIHMKPISDILRMLASIPGPLPPSMYM